MKSSKQNSTHNQTGFSLVEILVGLAIGLLATLVIMQVFSVFEGQKRTTTGSADAQTNGSIALYTIGHELQMAGFGLLPSEDSPLECTTLNFGATGIPDLTPIPGISPVTITDGGIAAGASDIITIRYATSASGGIPSPIIGQLGANAVTIDNNLGCQVGDIAMIINGASCDFTTVVTSAAPNLTTVTLQNSASAVNGANLSCLGVWKEIQYRINPNYDPTVLINSQAYLQRTEASYPVPAAGNPAAAPSVADIVNIQAQYGISSVANSNLINQWVDATGSWAAPSVANRNRIKAVRIAVVARNGLLEKNVVTYPCGSLTATSPVGLCAWDATSASPTIASPAPSVDLSNDKLPGDPANDRRWQHYRYRVFETIIPLRNMIWSKETL